VNKLKGVMPTRVAHKKARTPYASGSTEAAIKAAKKSGHDGIDLDVNVTADGVRMVDHWPYPLRDDAWTDPLGQLDPKTTRIDKIDAATAKRLTSKYGDMLSVYEAMVICKRESIIPCLEIKASAAKYILDQKWWDDFKTQCDAHDFDPVIMTLPRGGQGIQVLKRAHTAGFRTMWLWRGEYPDTHNRFITYVKSRPGHGIYKVEPAKPEPVVVVPVVKPEPVVGAARAAALSKSGPKFGTNECKMRVRLLFDVPSDGSADASTAWGRTKFKHKGTNAPANGIYWWTGGSSGHGHVTVATGKGDECWSTDIKRPGHFDLTSVSEINRTWPKLKFQGWSEDIDGVRVITVASDKPKPDVAPPTTPAKPNLKGFKPTIDGVDISHHQAAPLDWAKAKAAGVKFAYHKVSEGTSFHDVAYTKRRAECAKAGVPFGGYHFARPGSSNGAAQARFFLSVCTPKAGDMRPMLDLEDRGGLSDAALTVWVKAFVAEVKKETGKAPIIYTPFSLTSSPGTFLWVPRYSNGNNLPRIPKPWDRWTIWQFSNGVYGRPNVVPGLGHVDINCLQPGFDLQRLIL
jgi:GH25 family lysozyme M1 (1,4-beta-N-acetylmuramidase)